MFLCNVLYNSVCKWLFGHDSTTALHITLHSTPTRLDGIHPVQIHLIGIRHSPDHRRVRHKGVKFIWIYSLAPDLVSVVRIRESPYYRGSIKNFVGTLETVRNREVSVPRGSTVPPNDIRQKLDKAITFSRTCLKSKWCQTIYCTCFSLAGQEQNLWEENGL